MLVVHVTRNGRHFVHLQRELSPAEIGPRSFLQLLRGATRFKRKELSFDVQSVWEGEQFETGDEPIAQVEPHRS